MYSLCLKFKSTIHACVCVLLVLLVLSGCPLLCSTFKLSALFIKHDLFERARDQMCLNVFKASAKRTNAADYCLIVVEKWLTSTIRV